MPCQQLGWISCLPFPKEIKQAGRAAALSLLSAKPFPELVTPHLEDSKLFFYFSPSLRLRAGVCLANETLPAALAAPAWPSHQPQARVPLAIPASLAETS